MNFAQPTTLQLLSSNSELFDDPAWQAVLLRKENFHKFQQGQQQGQQGNHLKQQQQQQQSSRQSSEKENVLPVVVAAPVPTPILAHEFLDNLFQLGGGGTSSSSSNNGIGIGIGGHQNLNQNNNNFSDLKKQNFSTHNNSNTTAHNSSINTTHQLLNNNEESVPFPSAVLHAAANAISTSSSSSSSSSTSSTTSTTSSIHTPSLSSSSQKGLMDFINNLDIDLGFGLDENGASKNINNNNNNNNNNSNNMMMIDEPLTWKSLSTESHTTNSGAATTTTTTNPTLNSSSSSSSSSPPPPTYATARDRFTVLHVKVNDAFLTAIEAVTKAARPTPTIPDGLATESSLLMDDNSNSSNSGNSTTDQQHQETRKKPRLSIEFNSEMSTSSPGVFNIEDKAFGFTFAAAAPNQQGGATCLRLFAKSDKIYTLGSLDDKITIKPLITKELLAKTKAREEIIAKERQAKITQSIKINSNVENNKILARRLHIAADAQKANMNGRISPLPLLANNNSKPTNPPSSSSSSSSSFLNPTNTQRPTNTSYIPGAASIPAPAPSSSTASPNPPSLRRVILHLLAAKPQTKEDLIKRARSILKAKVDVVDVEQILLSIGKCATNQVYYLQTAIFKQVDLASAFYTPPERKSAHEKQIAAFERLTIKETDPIWIATEEAYKRGQELDAKSPYVNQPPVEKKRPFPSSTQPTSGATTATATTTATANNQNSASPVSNSSSAAASTSSTPSTTSSLTSATTSPTSTRVALPSNWQNGFENDIEWEQARQYYNVHFERYTELENIIRTNRSEFEALGKSLKEQDPSSEKYNEIVATIYKLYETRKETMANYQQELRELFDELKELKSKIVQYQQMRNI